MPRNEASLSGIGYTGTRNGSLGSIASVSPETRITRSPIYPTSLSMADEWYIDIGGTVEGPLPVEELRDRAANGRLRPTDSVSVDRMTWVPAHSVNGLTFPTSSRPLVETVVSGSVHLADESAAEGPSVIPIISVPGYQLLDTLGAGAFGVVYKAKQEKLNRIVALKTVLMPDKATQDLIDRFKQEAVSLAKLHHPNIVGVYDGGVCEKPKDQVYFAMELLNGEDLAVRLERVGPLDERTAWLIARQTASALAHAATHGIIHRDVKPANLFLVTPPTGFPLPPDVPMVKVTDFGLALAQEEAEGGERQRQTTAGVLLGTPVYMAPEQFTRSHVDERADIYSLGASMYHILTGQAPFDGRTVWEVMMKKSSSLPPLPQRISPESAALVAAMTATDPNERIADYAELIARIDALPCLEGAFSVSGIIGLSGRMRAASSPTGRTSTTVVPALPPTPVSSPPAPPRRTWWVYVIAAVALHGVAVGIAALAGAFHRPTEQAKSPDTLQVNEMPRTYITGAHQMLYKSGSILGWTPAGGSWAIESDDSIEKTQVLAGTGTAVRRFDPPANFRVTLSLDPHKAKTVEVQIATWGGSPTIHWLVRLDEKDGVAFGKRTGMGGFEPAGAAIPLPTPSELAAQSKRPYLEVKYERAGGKLVAYFQGKPLGSIADTGLTTTEFRIHATGGAMRIDYAALEELIEKK